MLQGILVQHHHSTEQLPGKEFFLPTFMMARLRHGGQVSVHSDQVHTASNVNSCYLPRTDIL